jgi:hypothetical protein
MHKFLIYNKFIIFLYMFRETVVLVIRRSNCIIQHLVSSNSVGGLPVRRLRESSLNLRTGRPSTCWASPLSTCAPDGHLHVESFLSQPAHRTATYMLRVLSQPTHRTANYVLREYSVNLRTGRPPTECDFTRCCIIQFDLLMMSTTVFETCRGT